MEIIIDYIILILQINALEVMIAKDPCTMLIFLVQSGEKQFLTHAKKHQEENVLNGEKLTVPCTYSTCIYNNILI